MSELKNDNRATDRIRDAPDRLDNSGKATGRTGRGERTNSPAFENWLDKYRYRLAKVLEAKLAEPSAEQIQGGRGLARV
jgi:hypothetical protein